QSCKFFESNLQWLRAWRCEFFNYTQPAKSPRIDEAKLAPRSQFDHSMCVFFALSLGRAHEQAAGHPQVHDPLRNVRPISHRLQVEDNMLPRAAHSNDSSRV